MSDMFYAAYGSNLHPHRLCTRVETARLIGTGLVDGMGVRFHKRGLDGSAKCSLVEAAEHTHVAVYAIDVEDQPVLDLIEGLGRGYDRAIVDVSGFGPCWTYIASSEAVDDSLVPHHWYKRLVLLGCEYHSFPVDYIDAIRKVPSSDDPLVERRTLNHELITQLEQAMPAGDAP
ncbi:gamma-glutamylcyclotransferase family protein [Allohahella sp. A8]|uniref:gamma-glutamylcyclotransferase family protein n=1 Tax=Allohahella sp. A8 TaxID=3141461 RepID=UPI003A7FC1FB